MKNKNSILDYINEEIEKINKESIKTDFLLGRLITLREIKFKIEEIK